MRSNPVAFRRQGEGQEVMLAQRRKTSSQVQKLRAKKRCGHVVLRGGEEKGKGRGSSVRGKAGEDRGKERVYNDRKAHF